MKPIAFVAAAIALAFDVAAGQAPDKVLTAKVTVKTQGYTTAVHGKAAGSKQEDFLFCIDQDRAGAAQAVNFSGEARVIYRPVAVPGVPESMAARMPESIAPVLTVVTGTGQAWSFVAKGQSPPQPPAAAAKPATIPISIIRKTDWSAGSGPRRGMDISSCLIAAG